MLDRVVVLLPASDALGHPLGMYDVINIERPSAEIKSSRPPPREDTNGLRHPHL